MKVPLQQEQILRPISLSAALAASAEVAVRRGITPRDVRASAELSSDSHQSIFPSNRQIRTGDQGDTPFGKAAPLAIERHVL